MLYLARIALRAGNRGKKDAGGPFAVSCVRGRGGRGQLCARGGKIVLDPAGRLAGCAAHGGPDRGKAVFARAARRAPDARGRAVVPPRLGGACHAGGGRTAACPRAEPGSRHPASGRGRHHYQGISASVSQRVPHAAPGRAAAGDKPHLGAAGAESAGRQAGHGGGEPANRR